jgi:protease-4
VAQGRIWSAQDALEHGLLDGLGTLHDAVAAAAARAGLSDYKVEYVARPLSARELFLRQLADRIGSLDVMRSSSLTATIETMLAPISNAAAELASLKDPRHIYARCIPCGAIR